MSFNVAAVRYSRNKDCFSVLSTDLFKLGFNEPFLVIKVVYENEQKAFFSWSGETISSSKNVLQINGLYANKLGLRENDEVIIEHVPSVPTCYRVRVEPLSVDDWEILERHALDIEAHLMDQVRIVWTGQILPVWVGNTCIFIKIGSVEPKSSCVMLTNETEVHVLPKLRNQSSIQQPVQEPFTKATVPSSEAPLSKMTDRQRQLINQEIKDLASGNVNSRHNNSNTSGSFFSSAVLSFFGIRSKSLPVEKLPVVKTEAQNVGHFPLSSQKPGLNLCLRVQQMLYDANNSSSKTPSNSRNSFPDFDPRAFPHQPSTVYVDLTDLEKQWKVNRNDINNIFYAKLSRLRSPKEQEQEKSAATVGKGRASPQKSKTKSKETDGNGLDSPSEEDAKSLTNDKKSEEVVTCVVRVIVIDNRRQFCNEDYQGAVESIFENQTLCRNSVFIPDLLRRYLKADITSRVWIQTVKPFIVKAVSFNLHVLGNVHKNITIDMIQKAFRHWLSQVADERHPLVVFQGLFVTFPVFPENVVEGQLIFTHNSEQREENIALLYQSVLNSTSLSVISGSREILHTTIRPMLAYTGVSSFDPYKPTVELSSLGGVSILAEKAISHLEICFASKPLNEKMFLTTPGLINGMLLIRGVKGSGKTSLAHAVLRQVADKPNYAHTVVVECKPLRGKKVDTIQKMLELLFNEAAWRQPAVILLDDLDHIMGSPSGPESEMSAEALYAARIAEVIKDLLRKEIRNLSQIAVIATSQSRSSLHPIIVSSRGTHFVQEVVEITPPNKVQRLQILEAMIKGRGTLMTKNEDSVDCTKIANKTEGYVARDLFNLLNRAVHAHILTMGRSSAIEGEMELTQDDFERAFHGFTPASLRNVPLHQAGELGWDDIGGLKDIKKTLVQTLQWPAKYPMLFANCPLRLQSGLLLYGAPGTGKTLLAGAVAKECGLNFISIKGPELLSKYIGASEQAIRDLFNRAQSAKPCILFFDEFDSIAPRRGHDNTGVTDRVVNQLLTQLDGVEGLDGVYVLGATSRPDLIDPALLRPGRLDKCLHCPMPDEDDRLQILEALVRKLNLARNVDLEYFAKKCIDFTGADIKALLYNSQLEAIHEFTDGNERLKISSPCKLPSENALYARTKDMMGDSKLRAKVMTKEKVKSSVSQSQFIYFPNLEEGARDLTPEMEERFNIQVSQIQICDRKMSVHIPQDEQIESPLSATKMFTVQQSHLEKALAKMRPSVSKEERLKYRRIYENFLLSRGGNFGTGIHDFTMKATLA